MTGAWQDPGLEQLLRGEPQTEAELDAEAEAQEQRDMARSDLDDQW